MLGCGADERITTTGDGKMSSMGMVEEGSRGKGGLLRTICH